MRRNVYGEGTDELILMDRPRSTVALVQESCGLLTGDSMDGGLPDMLDCLEPTLATPPAIGVSGTCGPCAYEVAHDGRFVDDFAACQVCSWQDWNELDAAEQPPSTYACLTCSLDVDGISAASASMGLECMPCLDVDAAYTFDVSSIVAMASIGLDCVPCPMQDAALLAIGIDSDNLLEPDVSTPTLGDVVPCAAPDLETRYYFLQDEQRSVYALTDSDGFVVEGYEYDPYGGVTVFRPATPTSTVTFAAGDDITGAEDALSPYLYTGRRHDPESGLLFYRSRYLDSEMGRFISRDTIGVWGDPNSLGNGYSYTANGPHIGLDAMGTIGGFCLSFMSEASCLRHCLNPALEQVIGNDDYDDDCFPRIVEKCWWTDPGFFDFFDYPEHICRYLDGNERVIGVGIDGGLAPIDIIIILAIGGVGARFAMSAAEVSALRASKTIGTGLGAKLPQAAYENSVRIPLKSLNDPNLRAALTADGSGISQWAKYANRVPSGSPQWHWYQNTATGQVYEAAPYGPKLIPGGPR